MKTIFILGGLVVSLFFGTNAGAASLQDLRKASPEAQALFQECIQPSKPEGIKIFYKAVTGDCAELALFVDSGTTLTLVNWDSKSEIDLEPLKYFHKLETLQISTLWAKTSHFEVIKTMPRLRSLKVSCVLPDFKTEMLLNPSIEELDLYILLGTGVKFPNLELEKLSSLNLKSLKTWLPLAIPQVMAHFTNLRTLELMNPDFEDSSFLSKLTQLENLELNGGPIHDYRFVESMPHLKKIWIWRTKIDSLEPFGKLSELLDLHFAQNSFPKGDFSSLSSLSQLKSFGCNECRLFDKDAEFLSGLKNLEYLSLDRNLLTNLGAIPSMEKMTYLTVGDNTQLKLDGIEKLKKLTLLTIYRTNASDNDIDKLVGLPLTRLNVGRYQFSEAALSKLKTKNPKLQISTF